MAQFLTSNEKFHVFSKSPVTGSQALSQAVNKSGHTTTTSDVWAQEIPWFYATDSQANAIKYSKNAKTNDLVDINGSVYIRKNTTEFPYNAEGAFETMWSAYDLSANPVLKNSAGEEVLRYHEGVSASLLTTGNNANQASNFAARIWVDGHLIEQFVASTDKILDGFPSTGYGVSLWNGSTPISEGELDDNFIANSYAGVIQLNKNWGSLNPNFKVNCFEYIGKKLDAEVKRLSDAVFGSGNSGESGEQPVDLVTQVNLNTAAIATLNGSATETGSVAKAVADAEGRVKVTTDALAGRIAQLEGITHFEVKVVDALPAEADLEANTIYLVKDAASTAGDCYEYVAYFDSTQNKVVAEQIGTTTVDLEGYTTDAEYEALAGETGRVTVVEGKVKTLEETTVPALEQAISDAKDAAIASATVKLTQGTGITITNSGTAQHEFTISVSDAVATSADLQALTNRVSTNEGAIKTITEETIVALDGRLSDAEATITTLTGSGDDSIAKKIESAINAAKSEIKETTDAIAATANTAVQSASGDTYVSAAKEAGTTNIKVTTNITAIDEELVKTTSKVGGAIKAASDAAAKAASDASSELTAAKAEIKETTDALAAAITKAQGDAVTTANGYTDAQVAAAKAEIKGTTDGLAADIKGIKDVIGETEDGETITDVLSGIREELTSTTATANSAAQSAEGDTYVSASQTGTKITVSTNIANITSHVDTELVKSGTAVATAIKAASDAGTGAAAEALAAAQTAQQTAEARISSVTEGTDSSLLTVSTEGTAVTITLDGDVATKTNISETALTGEGESSDKHVKVTLGGTLGNQTVTVTTDDIASAAALQALSDRVTGLHQTPQFSVVVVAGVTDLANWKDAVEGGVKKNTIYLVENTEAADGSYIEFIAYESGETVVTEKIGTTKTDLADYAKTADLNVTETTVNGLTYSQTDGVVSVSVAQASTSQVGTVQLTDAYTSTDDTQAATGKSIAAAIGTLATSAPVGEGAVKVSQTNGVVSSVTVDTEALVSENAIKESTTSETALITAKDALEAIKLAKPENYVASVTGYTDKGAEVTTTQGAAVKVLDGRGTSVTADDLWGTTATMDADGVITIDRKYLSNPNVSEAWDSSITKVEDNKAYVGDTLYGNIQTDMIKDGSYMFHNSSQFTSFNGGLSNLTNGAYMFNNCQNLTTFSSDLSNLTDGHSMFYGTKLTTFDVELPNLMNGGNMFTRC